MGYYKVKELGKLDELVSQENGKVFLHDSLALTSCEISINCVPQGFKVPFDHKHKQNEEIYIFIKGAGQMSIDGEIVEVKEGSCVRISPAAKRNVHNTSNADLQFICIQAKEGSLSQFGLCDGEVC